MHAASLWGGSRKGAGEAGALLTMGPNVRCADLTCTPRPQSRRLQAELDEWEREYDAMSTAEANAREDGGEVRQTPQPFPYLCVLDVEATCEEDVAFHDYQHEIIEFPVVVLDLSNGGGVIGEFHSFVRPTVNSTLSAFCSHLTGITQELVDSAPTLPDVLAQFEEWRLARGLIYSADEKNFAFAVRCRYTARRPPAPYLLSDFPRLAV
eukprot:382855-Prymnesium_polylepis.1